MTPALATRRLFLRPIELADAAQVQVIFPHWDVVKYLAASVPWPYPDDAAYLYYRDVALPGEARGEEWYWSLRLKDEPARVIGTIALARNANDNRGFWLGLEHHGQGLMSEAVDAVTDFWFGQLQQPVMRVEKAAANVASRRISEKNGMRLVGTGEKEFVAGRLPVETWETTAEEWRLHRERGTGRTRGE